MEFVDFPGKFIVFVENVKVDFGGFCWENWEEDFWDW